MTPLACTGFGGLIDELRAQGRHSLPPRRQRHRSQRRPVTACAVRPSSARPEEHRTAHSIGGGLCAYSDGTGGKRSTPLHPHRVGCCGGRDSSRQPSTAERTPCEERSRRCVPAFYTALRTRGGRGRTGPSEATAAAAAGTRRARAAPWAQRTSVPSAGTPRGSTPAGPAPRSRTPSLTSRPARTSPQFRPIPAEKRDHGGRVASAGGVAAPRGQRGQRGPGLRRRGSPCSPAPARSPRSERRGCTPPWLRAASPPLPPPSGPRAPAERRRRRRRRGHLRAARDRAHVTPRGAEGGWRTGRLRVRRGGRHRGAPRV